MMREYVYRIESFQPFEFEAMERRLSRMARRGFQLDSIGSLFWKYRREAPRPTAYAVTYLPQCSPFDPQDDPETEALRELCAEAGWEKACDWGQLQIYRTDRERPVPFETDESVRLAAIRRSMRRSFLLPNAVLLLLVLFELGWLFFSGSAEPLALLSNAAAMLVFALLPVVLLLLLLHFAAYAVWLRRSLRSVARGGRCASSGFCRRADTVFLVLVLAAAASFAVFSAASGQGGAASYALLYFLCFLGMVAALNSLRRRLSREGFSRGGNRTLVIAADVAMAIALAVVMVFASGLLSDGPQAPPAVDAGTLEHAPSGAWDAFTTKSASPVLSHVRVRQYETGGDEILFCDVYDARLPGLSGWCANQLLAEWEEPYRTENAAPLSADAAYHVSFPTGREGWILADGSRTVRVTASFPLTEADLARLFAGAA